MSEISGPVSTLPGHTFRVPDGAKCDEHPDRDAVRRIQGETDSFGAEYENVCQECLDEYRQQIKNDRLGTCDWCGKEANDLRKRRDYDEGMCGPVYDVCGACVKREEDEAREELERYSSWD